MRVVMVVVIVVMVMMVMITVRHREAPLAEGPEQP
jgi:heme/copper-type cytochrome/quinol oxidase subunit 2